MYLILFPINIALYYKESSAVLLIIIAFATIYFIMRCNKKYFNLSLKSVKILKKVLFLLILSIAIYITLYTVYTNPIKPDSYYSKLVPNNSLIDRLSYSLKSIFLYMTTDFLIFVFLSIIFMYSNFRNFKQKIKINIPNKLFIANILFIITFLFILFHITIGIHSNYYLLPVYPFAILSLSLYFDLIIASYLFKDKIILFLFTPIIFLNSINSTINEVLFLRLSSKNFMKYQLYLNDLLNQKNISNNSKQTIFFLGVNDITYHTNIENNFLEFYNIYCPNLSFKSMQDLGTKPISDLKTNIYFVITPNANETKLEINDKIKTLRLKKIFETKSEYNYELPEFRHIVKYFIIKFNKNSIQSPNIYRDVDFGIFTKF